MDEEGNFSTSNAFDHYGFMNVQITQTPTNGSATPVTTELGAYCLKFVE